MVNNEWMGGRKDAQYTCWYLGHFWSFGLLYLPGADEKLMTLLFDVMSTESKKMALGELGSGKEWKQRGPCECEGLMNRITGDIFKKK